LDALLPVLELEGLGIGDRPRHELRPILHVEAESGRRVVSAVVDEEVGACFKEGGGGEAADRTDGADDGAVLLEGRHYRWDLEYASHLGRKKARDTPVHLGRAHYGQLVSARSEALAGGGVDRVPSFAAQAPALDVHLDDLVGECLALGPALGGEQGYGLVGRSHPARRVDDGRDLPGDVARA